MQLRQGLRVLRRAADEVQVGLDPRWAVRVAGLSTERADRLLRAGDRRVDDALPAPALDALGAAGLLRPAGSRPRRVRPDLRPEVLAHGLAREDGDGVGAVRRRARSTVAVVGLGRPGVVVAGTLAVAGVGTLVLVDPRPPGPGLPAAAAGGAARAGADDGARTPDRATAVAGSLRGVAPGARVRTAPGPGGLLTDPHDVVVTVATDAPDPATALTLLGADVPHLPVVTREADALVGPFVRPARPGDDPLCCLRCLDLQRAAADPAWPVVLAQLVGPRPGDAVAEPPAALAAVAGGLAAAEVLAHLDGGEPRTLGAQYEIPVPSVAPRLRRWAAHPECGCAAPGA
ncbi:thiamine biosynthesis protein ThiF [Cellulomonas sp. ACRRI]|uniref:thiamine biosynthesis protein ThiF n=1 Tax=Cellulomonas sp. ACRRI TaxID=2918188 RepID=UPI001EF1AF11|nr:thiamine biosynthesis protein ThiF [Cellulomonas sp. ACRRI]MCG7285227.1 thiamine biosynthesis protein ThiF [Cellulomonas sp. ACRRI]